MSARWTGRCPVDSVAKSLETALTAAVATVGLRPRDAAERWGVPHSTVRVWAHRGRIATARTGSVAVVPHAEVERVATFIAEGRW